jgi:hypothetical protein
MDVTVLALLHPKITTVALLGLRTKNGKTPSWHSVTWHRGSTYNTVCSVMLGIAETLLHPCRVNTVELACTVSNPALHSSSKGPLDTKENGKK